MAIAAACRDSLQSFECACRDNTINFETIQHMLDKLFLVSGEVPNDLESLELLDAFADHFTTTCEEEVRRMVFHLLFPCGFNVNPLREQFLIRLTQLAICVGLTPLLDLVAVWLKGQIFLVIQSLSSSKDYCLLDERLVEAARPVSSFIRRIFDSLMTVDGMSEVCKDLHENADFSSAAIFDKPFINLLRLSPLFVSALVSGVTLAYSTPFIQGEKELFPPPLVLEILIIWLKSSPAQIVRQDWTTVDWKTFFLSNPPRFLDMSKVKGQDWPLLLAEAWHPVRGLVWLTVLSSNCRDLSEPVASLLAELHCELLENFATPLNRGKHSRNSSGMATDMVPIMWRLKFSTELKPLLSRFGAVFAEGVCSELFLIRIAELLFICWRSGRLLECDSGDVSNALRPFSSEGIIQIVEQGLRI
ncbi:EGF type aspartate asparagine hydroxylation site [Echinococcus multilocularis]|uniref:EGF type aspartate asparagine hydroxylation site n=1 Tax=Echinococcus multilocularis TaxID=6211 RepID=A0A068Y3J6_ECHMU|nr:EGF type aspartate asparagine hydroxylation site [Echinococcus multilocularis]